MLSKFVQSLKMRGKVLKNGRVREGARLVCRLCSNSMESTCDRLVAFVKRLEVFLEDCEATHIVLFAVVAVQKLIAVDVKSFSVEFLNKRRRFICNIRCNISKKINVYKQRSAEA